MQRRDFLKIGLGTAAGLVLHPRLTWADGGTTSVDDPHFFLLLTLPNPSGLDSSYMFDARPVEMTTNNIIQNYRKNPEPLVWTGSNGVSTLAADLVQPLNQYKSYFSILNGVTMATGFDGHDQNVNFLYAGDPFGGASFLPLLNTSALPTPLDAIQRGPVKASLNNTSRTVPLSPVSGANLVKSLKSLPPLNPNSELFAYFRNRFETIGKLDSGSFSLGTQNIGTSFAGAPSLANLLSGLNITGVDSDVNYLPMLAQFFKMGVARSAVLTLDIKSDKYDTHDTAAASLQGESYARLAESLAAIMETMRTTAFDEKRSLMDVTTFVFSAEFGRTLKQFGKPSSNTGTDHNPLANSVLVGGKGIKTGLVLGSSDYASTQEILSPVHSLLDPKKLKTMGRPFDFSNGISRSDLPSTFKAGDYLGFNSIVNSIHSLFGVPQSQWRLTERNGTLAPVVSRLIS